MMVQPSVEKSKRLLSHSIALHLAHTQCLTGAMKDPYDSDTLEGPRILLGMLPLLVVLQLVYN